MSPTFSIIIPAYNVAPYVRTSLDSVFAAAQHLPPHPSPLVEVICVDDGSTDGTGEILDEIVSSFEFRVQSSEGRSLANNSKLQTSNSKLQTSNIKLQTSNFKLQTLNFKLIHQQNAGVGVARNAGLDVATGDWILFADADDAYLPETLVYLAKAVQEADADVFHFGYCEVREQNAPVVFVERPAQRYDLTSPTEARTAYALAGMLMVWNVCARRSVIGNLRFETNMPISEDCLFEQQLFFRAKSFAATPTVLYKYYQRPGSAIHTPTVRGVLSAIRSLQKQDEAFESWPMKESAVAVYRKRVRTTYFGQIYERVRLLSPVDQNVVWPLYVEVGRQVTRRLGLEHLAFASGWRPLIELVSYLPYRLKVRAHAALRRCV